MEHASWGSLMQGVGKLGYLPITFVPLWVAGCPQGHELLGTFGLQSSWAKHAPPARKSPTVKSGVCSKLLHQAEVSAMGHQEPLLHRNSKNRRHIYCIVSAKHSA